MATELVAAIALLKIAWQGCWRNRWRLMILIALFWSGTWSMLATDQWIAHVILTSALDLRVNSIRYCEPAWIWKMQRPHIWGIFLQCCSWIEMHRWNNWTQFLSHSFRTNCRRTWLRRQWLVIIFPFLLCISPGDVLCAESISGMGVNAAGQHPARSIGRLFDGWLLAHPP